MEDNLRTDSITIGINHKEEKGVPHLHIHLIPRFKSDGGKVIQSLPDSKISEELTKTLDKLRSN
jgi:diadenosine tetraphosphate (Ap4A) HIT family hydrolase